ncbi:MAG: hypothetical protein M3389_10775, partial [Actinomycetota bacterium]|nr:hypothetical protein [Actinomycetota bacterium]
MRGLVLLLAVLLVLGLPAVALAVPAGGDDVASCQRTGAETRLTARVVDGARGGTKLVVCDVRTKRARVLRRGSRSLEV